MFFKKNVRLEFKRKETKKQKKSLSLDKGKKKKSENVGLSGPILQPKKKPVFLFYIYDFYFENLIYK